MHGDAAQFAARGFVVLRAAFDAAALADEVRDALAQGAPAAFRASVAGGDIGVAYVPMMCARTPRSLALLDALETVAVALTGGPVLPTRAKGVRYTGETPWHVDTARRVASVGFAAYLEPLDETNGALRVVPGSHRTRAAPSSPAHTDAIAVATAPGDVIAFDEHLLHSSTGGGRRHQWRCDFVRDRHDDDESELAGYFADIFPPGAPVPYDAARLPSYGPDWLSSARPAVARLRALGVYDLARGR